VSLALVLLGLAFADDRARNGSVSGQGEVVVGVAHHALAPLSPVAPPTLSPARDWVLDDRSSGSRRDVVGTERLDVEYNTGMVIADRAVRSSCLSRDSFNWLSPAHLWVVAFAGSLVVWGCTLASIFVRGFHQVQLLAASGLATADVLTDIAIASTWYVCGLYTFATLSFVFIALATIVRLIGITTSPEFSSDWGLSLATILQVGALYASMLSIWRGNELAEDPAVERLRLAEAAYEGSPQIHLQTYVLLHLGVLTAPSLSYASLALSLVAMALAFGRYDEEQSPQSSNLTMAVRVSARTYAFTAVFGRALAFALVACAFGLSAAWGMLAITMVGIVVLLLVAGTEQGSHVVLLALFYGTELVLDHQLSWAANVGMGIWLSLVDVVCGALAVSLHSEWAAQQPAVLLKIFSACIMISCVLKLGSLATLFKPDSSFARNNMLV